MRLYPRLPAALARELALEERTLDLATLEKRAQLEHPAAVYAPTGPPRVTRTELAKIRDAIKAAAMDAGYPRTSADRGGFDAVSGRILHEQMDLSPAEASHQGVWTFLSCVMLPEVVRWRFPGDDGITNPDRFLGGKRAVRNTFGRVWWRGQVLRLSDDSAPYRLLDLLGEDELVQIMERPNLAGSSQLAVQVARSFLIALESGAGVTRSELLRDAMKRLRRLAPFVSFDALEQEQVQQLVDSLFVDSLDALQPRRTTHRSPRGERRQSIRLPARIVRALARRGGNQ